MSDHQVRVIKDWPPDQMGENWWFSPKDIGLSAYWTRDLAGRGVFRAKRFQSRYLYQWTDFGREVARLFGGSPE
jgi:hypothetical protein